MSGLGVGQSSVLDDPRGARQRARKIALHTCIRQVRVDLDHDAVMRIGGKAPRRQAHSLRRRASHACLGSPPPRIVIGAAVRATRRRNRLSAISFPAACSRRCTQDDTLRNRRRQFFQRLAVDAGNDAGHQPAGLAHLNDDDQRKRSVKTPGQAAARCRLCGLPVPGQQIGDLAGRMIGDAGEHVGEIVLRVDAAEFGRSRSASRARRRGGRRHRSRRTGSFCGRSRRSAAPARRGCCRGRGGRHRGIATAPSSASACSGTPWRVRICRESRRRVVSAQAASASAIGLERFWRSRSPLVGRQAGDRLFDPVEVADAVERLLGDRRAAGGMDVEELAADVRPACVRTSPGKEDGCDLKPFIVTQRVRRPPGRGGARRPEASLAWVTATPLVKRRQQVLKPCGSLEIMERRSLRRVGRGGSIGKAAMARMTGSAGV